MIVNFKILKTPRSGEIFFYKNETDMLIFKHLDKYPLKIPMNVKEHASDWKLKNKSKTS